MLDLKKSLKLLLYGLIGMSISCSGQKLSFSKLNSSVFNDSKEGGQTPKPDAVKTAQTLSVRFACSTTFAPQNTILGSTGATLHVYRENDRSLSQPLATSGSRSEIINKKQISLPTNLPDGKYLLAIPYKAPVRGEVRIAVKNGTAKALVGWDHEVDLRNANLVVAYKASGNLVARAGNEEEEPCDEEIPVDPLVMDFGDDGIKLTSPLNGVSFDINKDGKADHFSWFKKHDDMLLVLDRNKDGLISGIDEMFGDLTTGPDGRQARDGFDALAKYDRNHDQVIDEKDSVFRDLRFWSDANRDAKTDPGELKTLSELGVAKISIPNTPYELFEKDKYLNETRRRSLVTLKDGTSRRIVDIWFRLIQLD